MRQAPDSPDKPWTLADGSTPVGSQSPADLASDEIDPSVGKLSYARTMLPAAAVNTLRREMGSEVKAQAMARAEQTKV
jgi:hypothetical protein